MKTAFSEGGDLPVWIGWFEDRLQGTTRQRDDRLSALWVAAEVKAQQDAARK
jgi:hypothetical protein